MGKKNVKYFTEKRSDIFLQDELYIDELCDDLEDIIYYENINNVVFGIESCKNKMILPDLKPLLYGSITHIMFINCCILEEDVEILNLLKLLKDVSIIDCDDDLLFVLGNLNTDLDSLRIETKTDSDTVFDLSILKRFTLLDCLYIEIKNIDLSFLKFMISLTEIYIKSNIVDCSKIVNERLSIITIINKEDIDDISFLKKLKNVGYIEIINVIDNLDYSPILSLEYLTDIALGKYNVSEIWIGESNISLTEYIANMKKEIFYENRKLKIKNILLDDE